MTKNICIKLNKELKSLMTKHFDVIGNSKQTK